MTLKCFIISVAVLIEIVGIIYLFLNNEVNHSSFLLISLAMLCVVISILLGRVKKRP